MKNETTEQLIQKIWGRDWRNDPELATKLRCIDCGREFYKAFQFSEDCPMNGEANNHRTSIEQPRGLSGLIIKFFNK